MAIGIDNPYNPGETVWVFCFEDLKEYLPDDIYKAVIELCEDADEEKSEEIDKEWREWQMSHLEDDQRFYQDLIDEIDGILKDLSNRNKKMDRGDLISRFRSLRKEVANQF